MDVMWTATDPDSRRLPAERLTSGRPRPHGERECGHVALASRLASHWLDASGQSNTLCMYPGLGP